MTSGVQCTGFSAHHELRYLVDAGFTPYEAIKTGTVNVGKFYGNNLQGDIKKGSPSDLLLLTGNPLKDISETKSIEGVMVGSPYLDKKFIEKGFAMLVKNRSVK